MIHIGRRIAGLTHGRRIVASGSAPAVVFDPTLYGTVYRWYEADQLVRDGAEDEDVIDTWPDQSINGLDATQTTFAKRPTLILNAFGSQPGLQFNGTSTFAAAPAFTGSAVTFFAVWKRVALAESGFLFASADLASNHHPYTDGNIYDGFGSTVRKSCGAAIADTTHGVVWSTRSAANAWSLKLNGQVQFSTGTNTVGFPSFVTIGSGNAVTPPTDYFLNGYIALILMYTSALSDANREAVEDQLGSKYGIAVTH